MDEKMKKHRLTFAFVVLFFIIFYVIIYNNKAATERSESSLVLEDFGGITMAVQSVEGTKITVHINYSADDPAIFGADYILEIKKGQRWYSLPVKDGIMFTSIGYQLKKGDSLPWSTDFEILYGKLSAGHYRIIKSFRIEPQQETSKEYFISAEFLIS
ncbi:MAG TPA: hypothetical protein DEQ64_13310 [Lachnoclostridium sp.]|jgi:preprotein translocase subunit YajC|uniref:immunoglobulin-like domain-containing protein n=1 Tax=Lacrimispora sp. TaxID=2719234 RepID=UPI000EDDA8CE|nr:immunoglobulin-like domain-containing protein [Lacrimispora sp.]HCD44687.1 hypothetical protein [Lachnoclostridium sp.]